MTVKLSVSLSDEAVQILDRFIDARSIPSRSAAIQTAIMQLEMPDLAQAYMTAADEWENGEDSSIWEEAVGDGLL